MLLNELFKDLAGVGRYRPLVHIHEEILTNGERSRMPYWTVGGRWQPRLVRTTDRGTSFRCFRIGLIGVSDIQICAVQRPNGWSFQVTFWRRLSHNQWTGIPITDVDELVREYLEQQMSLMRLATI